MPLSASQGHQIREEYSNIKEKELCDALGLKQIGGSRTKVDGSNGIDKVSIKHASGSSTQVHLTTQKHFMKLMNISGDCAEFIQHFCGSSDYDYKGKDRRTIKQIDEQYVNAFKKFLDDNKEEIIDLIIRNGCGITKVIYKDIKNDVKYELTYDEIIAKIKDTEWKFLSGGVHLKLGKKTLFHFQREGKRKPSNRYNVLWHIHRNLFVC